MGAKIAFYREQNEQRAQSYAFLDSLYPIKAKSGFKILR